jgi:hypothetical protein
VNCLKLFQLFPALTIILFKHVNFTEFNPQNFQEDLLIADLMVAPLVNTQGTMDVIKMLAKDYPELMRTQTLGKRHTPLHVAVEAGEVEIVQVHISIIFFIRSQVIGYFLQPQNRNLI